MCEWGLVVYLWTLFDGVLWWSSMKNEREGVARAGEKDKGK
jgi:hypothetical protein